MCAAERCGPPVYQPTGAEPDFYQVSFYEDRAEIMRRDGALSTTLEIAVSAEDDTENAPHLRV